MDVFQNTARGFFVFADNASAIGTGLAGLTITAEISKGDAAFNVVAPTITDRGDGVYWVSPIAAHRDTLGEVAWKFSADGAIIAPRFENVVAYDAQLEAVGASTFDPANDSVNVGSYTEGQSPADLVDLTGLFDDADVAQLLADITAKFDGADDLPVATIKTAVVNALLEVKTEFHANTDALSTFDPETDPVNVGTIEGTDATDYFDVILSGLSGILNKLTGITSLASWLRALARRDHDEPEISGEYEAATDSLEAIRNRGDEAWLPGSSGGAGSGARTQHVEVADADGEPLQNATIRLTEGVNTFTAQTNALGAAVFALDEATYGIAITKAGYSFAPTELTVTTAPEVVQFQMLQNTAPVPSDPTTARGLLTLLDETGQMEPTATATVQIVSGPGVPGFGYDSEPWTTHGDWDGLIPGATYRLWRGEPDDYITFAVPTDATGQTFDIDEVIGRD